jgi:hypothetical protein
VGRAWEAYVVSPHSPLKKRLIVAGVDGWVTTSHPITCLFVRFYLFWTVSKNFV